MKEPSRLSSSTFGCRLPVLATWGGMLKEPANLLLAVLLLLELSLAPAQQAPLQVEASWASQPRSLSRPHTRSELISRLYNVTSNPLHNFEAYRHSRDNPPCGQFPWSITDSQLEQIVDPVIERFDRRARADNAGSHGMLVLMAVGVFWGGTSVRLAERLLNHSLAPERVAVLSIDTWLGDLAMWANPEWARGALMPHLGAPRDFECFASAVARSGAAGELVVPLRLPSAMAARMLHPRGVRADLIYVDGSHDYADVLADLEAYSRLLRYKGVICGDDYHIPDVTRAVNDFARRKGQTVKTIVMRPTGVGSLAQLGWWL